MQSNKDNNNNDHSILSNLSHFVSDQLSHILQNKQHLLTLSPSSLPLYENQDQINNNNSNNSNNNNNCELNIIGIKCSSCNTWEVYNCKFNKCGVCCISYSIENNLVCSFHQNSKKINSNNCDSGNSSNNEWSIEDDTKLKQFVGKYGTVSWLMISKLFNLKKSLIDCRLRWEFINDNSSANQKEVTKESLKIKRFGQIPSPNTELLSPLSSLLSSPSPQILYPPVKIENKDESIVSVKSPPPPSLKQQHISNLESLNQKELLREAYNKILAQPINQRLPNLKIFYLNNLKSINKSSQDAEAKFFFFQNKLNQNSNMATLDPGTFSLYQSKIKHYRTKLDKLREIHKSTSLKILDIDIQLKSLNIDNGNINNSNGNNSIKIDNCISKNINGNNSSNKNCIKNQQIESLQLSQSIVIDSDKVITQQPDQSNIQQQKKKQRQQFTNFPSKSFNQHFINYQAEQKPAYNNDNSQNQHQQVGYNSNYYQQKVHNNDSRQYQKQSQADNNSQKAVHNVSYQQELHNNIDYPQKIPLNNLDQRYLINNQQKTVQSSNHSTNYYQQLYSLYETHQMQEIQLKLFQKQQLEELLSSNYNTQLKETSEFLKNQDDYSINNNSNNNNNNENGSNNNNNRINNINRNNYSKSCFITCNDRCSNSYTDGNPIEFKYEYHYEPPSPYFPNTQINNNLTNFNHNINGINNNNNNLNFNNNIINNLINNNKINNNINTINYNNSKDHNNIFNKNNDNYESYDTIYDYIVN